MSDIVAKNAFWYKLKGITPQCNNCKYGFEPFEFPKCSACFAAGDLVAWEPSDDIEIGEDEK